MAFFKPVAHVHARKTATHLTFHVAGQLYAVPIALLSEIVPVPRLAHVTSVDAAIVGEMSLHDGAIVVVDMGMRLLGARIPESPRACVLIVHRERARSGILVSAPGTLENIPEDEIEFSGCLVENAEAAETLEKAAITVPENTSLSGTGHGFPLCKLGEETVLLPPEDLFFPL